MRTIIIEVSDYDSKNILNIKTKPIGEFTPTEMVGILNFVLYDVMRSRATQEKPSLKIGKRVSKKKKLK